MQLGDKVASKFLMKVIDKQHKQVGKHGLLVKKEPAEPVPCLGALGAGIWIGFSQTAGTLCQTLIPACLGCAAKILPIRRMICVFMSAVSKLVYRRLKS